MKTRLSAPTMVSWVIALILGALGVLNHSRVVNLRLGVDDFWLVTAGFVILLVATLLRRI